MRPGTKSPRKQKSQPRAKSKTRVPTNRWSKTVTRESNALDLEPGVFTMRNPRQIAESLRRSAEQSSRRKAEPYQAAMSMLTFYINRAGKGLSAERRKTLQQAKDELRKQFGVEEK